MGLSVQRDEMSRKLELLYKAGGSLEMLVPGDILKAVVGPTN